MKQLLRAWFSLREPVSRAAYLAGGVVFMLLKFGIERAIFSAWVGRELGLIAFLSPFFVHRAELLRGAPDGATWTMIGLAMPFLWIGVSMSARRALDAGLPPMLGFLFLIPGVNYLLMLALSLVPTRRPADRQPAEGAYRPAPDQVALPVEMPKEGASNALRATRAILAAAGIGFGMFGFSVYVLKSYGSALFVATPFVMGMVAALSYRGAQVTAPPDPVGPAGGPPASPRPRIAVGCAWASVALVGVGLLFMAQEGLACLGMALVPAGVLSLLGALLAMAIGSVQTSIARSRASLLVLPLAAGIESGVQKPPEHEVVTSVVVDAPPEVVWRHVVSFPDLAPPTEWMFRRGIAYPMRARIEGTGVGAIRYCEFSTGAFVEPITRWEPGHRLTFDVVESPPPMREWSFWDRVDAPHLHGFMRSKHGEFRLVALPDGRTRLEGSTFYELEIFPELYWKLWSDGIVHAIHGRVLRHIQQLSEAEAR
jgi:hypothetical protein